MCGYGLCLDTREAEAFAILKEEGISKGVRRITAVTRAAATASRAAGEKLEVAVKECPVTDGERLKALRKDVDASDASAVVKAELRERLEHLTKEGQQAAAGAKKELAAAALESSRPVVQAAIDAGDGYAVLAVPGADIGALKSAAEQLLY